jgi:hypothetical protein
MAGEEDVEGFAHVCAARAQQLRHVNLIGYAVEPRHHRIGRGRHLTERKCSRKDLDEQRFPWGVGSRPEVLVM